MCLTKEKHIQNLNRKTKSDLVSYMTKAKRDKIDNCKWQVVWIYCHGEGRTTSGAKSLNYIAYQVPKINIPYALEGHEEADSMYI
ncbi:hypothetical protein FCULG_00012676 [Fusarium culmorum]|uniref:Uncharacterized protein n=1 Tax=Fusarium culmorum TaxID=5516 RepID=A0A2T4GCP6_FUSCU|nr:hypothetical protein FCULG_00012676 [Fusarium culmorum]